MVEDGRARADDDACGGRDNAVDSRVGGVKDEDEIEGKDEDDVRASVVTTEDDVPEEGRGGEGGVKKTCVQIVRHKLEGMVCLVAARNALQAKHGCRLPKGVGTVTSSGRRVAVISPRT